MNVKNGSILTTPEEDAAWKAWAEANKTNEEETPYALLKRLRSEDRWEDLCKVSCPPDRTTDMWDIELSEFMRL